MKIKKIIIFLSKKILRVPNPKIFFESKKRSFEKNFFTKKFNSKDFVNFIEDLGIEEKDTVFFPSSWNEFYNFNDGIKDLINSLIEFLGDKGNLVMPSNTNLYCEGSIFDVKKTPTNAGLIAELFRRSPNVKRSIHLNSSVCAHGKNSEFLCRGHEKSISSWDDFSPYKKLYDLDATILTVGCGYFFSMGTPWHRVDSIMLNKEDKKFKKIYNKKIKYFWKDCQSKGEAYCLIRQKEANLNFINKYLKDVPHLNNKISNLKGYSVKVKPLVNKGVELAQKGITMYGKL